MKRFFCVICMKIRRAQKWPGNLGTMNNPISKTIQQRTGRCARHYKIK